MVLRRPYYSPPSLRREVRKRALWKTMILHLTLLLGVPNLFLGEARVHKEPYFLQPIGNVTVIRGRDAILHCYIKHLGGYKVGWLKLDTKAIQAVHKHLVTHNPRVSISNSNSALWSLHFRNIQAEDGGYYMCQVNTDPMISEIGLIHVVVPPDIISQNSSGDLTVNEGSPVKLFCQVTGNPHPNITWKREDNQLLSVFDSAGQRKLAESYEGDVLEFLRVSRIDTGAYLCIASNGLPPSVSKRIVVTVNFQPSMHVPTQLVGAPLYTDVDLMCIVESSNNLVSYWMRENGSVLLTNHKYRVGEVLRGRIDYWMSLTVRNLTEEDLGIYVCAAKNSFGEINSTIRIYKIARVEDKDRKSNEEEDDNNVPEEDASNYPLINNASSLAFIYTSFAYCATLVILFITIFQ